MSLLTYIRNLAMRSTNLTIGKEVKFKTNYLIEDINDLHSDFNCVRNQVDFGRACEKLNQMMGILKNEPDSATLISDLQEKKKAVAKRFAPKVFKGSFSVENGVLDFVCNTKDVTFNEVKEGLLKLQSEITRQLANEKECQYYEPGSDTNKMIFEKSKAQ